MGCTSPGRPHRRRSAQAPWSHPPAEGVQHVRVLAIGAAESFFSTLKNDLIYRTSWETRQDAKLAIFEYIEAFYNRERHSLLGQVSPEVFEARYRAGQVA